MATRPRRHWVIVVSREHARRGVTGGFVMANHGKRAPLARMSRGDGILIYSPTTSYPSGEPLRAVTVVGEVSGDEPEPSDVIAGGFCRPAKLREIQPLPLEQIRAPPTGLQVALWLHRTQRSGCQGDPCPRVAHSSLTTRRLGGPLNPGLLARSPGSAAQAAGRGARVAHFPEGALSGYAGVDFGIL